MNKKFKLAAFMFGVAFLGSGLAMNNENLLQNENNGKRISTVVGNESSATTKSKGTIYIDSMMIVGKYLNSNNDYINIMKVNKKYHDLAAMYHFNPIPDTDLFTNMETQYLYNENDTKREGMYQYVYWYGVNCDTQRKKENDIFKRYVLNNATKTAAVITNGELTIPAQFVSIRDITFDKPVTSITFPPNLKNIGDGVFQYSYIRKLILPEGVLSLGNDCFAFCGHLKEVQMPSTLISIGDYCFVGSGIKKIILPDSVLSLGEGCFMGCEDLEEVKIPASLKAIGDDGFRGSGIKKIIIPYGVKSLGNHCFRVCRSLQEVQIPASIQEIGDGVFQDSGIQQLILPEGVLSLGNYWFKDCMFLEKVQTPVSLKSIGDSCFESCWQLTDVTILGNPIIGEDVFENSQSLEEVKVTDDFKQHQSVFSSRNKTRQVKVIDMNDNSAEDKTEQSEKKYEE